ncbi:MAG: ATP-binding protein [Gammaproteobacteria bacterium]|jgi:signal transduction histidine kinase
MKIFPGKTAWQTFLILFFGFIIILLAALFVSNAIWQIAQRHQPDFTQKIHKVVQIYDRVKLSFKDKKPRLIKVTDSQRIRAHLANHPAKMAQQFLKPTEVQIIQWFKAHPGSRRIALKLENGKWLNIVIIPSRRHLWWAFAGFGLLAIILIALVILLCAWAVKRLAVPLSDVAKAAKHLGVDINMPLLAKTNNPEINEIIDAFNQVQTRIRKMINDRTQMLAAISHDLRTPITRLKLRAESFEDAAQHDKMIADLQEMEDMITSVLLFAREDACNEVLEKFDLNALLESLCDDLIDAGFDVSYQSSITRLPFFGCIGTLKRAFANLINNAVKYGKQAEVSLKQKDNLATIEIIDNGPGIPEADLLKVFEPFYRVDQSRSRKTGGTGLGLTIARDTIIAHNGEIVLMNLPGGGFKVIVTLPLEA